MEKQKRMRMKTANKRWTKEDTLVFLHKILENKNQFEKPSAQIFYKKIINEEVSLREYSWIEMRDRMRNLKMKYKNAITWRANTRSGVLDEDSEKTVEEYLLKLCPFFKEIDEIYGGKVTVIQPFSFDSTDSAPVLEVDVNMDGAVVIAQGEEEYPLNQSTWLAASLTPEETEKRLESPPHHSMNYYKERLIKNPGERSIKAPLDYIVQVFPTENTQQNSEPDIECQNASKPSERTQPAMLKTVSNINTPGKTEKRKLNQAQSSTSKNKKNIHDHEISSMSSAIDKLLEISNCASQVTKDDSFDHFGRYVASMLRGLGQPTAVRLQQNITNMIASAMCPLAECSTRKKTDTIMHLITAAEKLANSTETKSVDSWEAFGLSVGGDLRNMENKQQSMAQKLISDVIFLAKTGRFNEGSGINVSSLFHME